MSDTCTATANPRQGLLLRCDRTVGHEKIPDAIAEDRIWHYDLQQDADWRCTSDGWLLVEFRTVGATQ